MEKSATIVYVFSVPVWPYANIVQLYPSNTESITFFPDFKNISFLTIELIYYIFFIFFLLIIELDFWSINSIGVVLSKFNSSSVSLFLIFLKKNIFFIYKNQHNSI